MASYAGRTARLALTVETTVKVVRAVAHFFDTLVVDEVPGSQGILVVGFQALASPQADPRDQPDPGLVLESLKGLETSGLEIENPEQLVRVLTYVIVNPPLVRREDRAIYESPEAPFPPELVEWVRTAIRSPLIAVEESPLSKRSIAELTATATTTALYFIGVVPVLVARGRTCGPRNHPRNPGPWRSVVGGRAAGGCHLRARPRTHISRRASSTARHQPSGARVAGSNPRNGIADVYAAPGEGGMWGHR